MSTVDTRINKNLPDATQDNVVLHSVRPENVVFCYRRNDTDSLDVARFYANKRGVPDDHLIPLDCSSDNIISETEYINDIERPLYDAVRILDSRGNSSGSVNFSTGYTYPGGSVGEKLIWVIILGYHIPHGYWPGDDPYSAPKAIASRLHRLGLPEQNSYPNFTYDRRGDFRFFTATDAENIYITAVIDGPSKSVAMRLVERSIDIDNQTFVAGQLYCDPFGRKSTSSQLDYQEDILDFLENEAPNLNLTIVKTIDSSKNTVDPTVAFFKNDAFYWGWYRSTYSQNLFFDQPEKRIFLYNADDSSGEDISSSLDNINGSNPWCNIAINIEPGYAATAGAISAVEEIYYLRPRPFFESLHRGACLGEAFLYSSPVVDWKIFLIGDPLLTILFPSDLPADQNPTNTLITNNEAIRRVKESIEESAAWLYRQSNLTTQIADFNATSFNFSEELNLLYRLGDWKSAKSEEVMNDLLTRSVQSLMSYILVTTDLTFAEWLEQQNDKTTDILNNVLLQMGSGYLTDTDLLHPSGHWTFEFTYLHPLQTLEKVHFQIQLSYTPDFSIIDMDVQSSLDNSGWTYEYDVNDFIDLPSVGLSSNFSGRRVRYSSVSSNYLPRLEIYWLRWRALRDDLSPITDYQTESRQFIIKR